MLNTPFSPALLTDLYQISMVYCYWKEGFDNKEAVFNLFFRRAPFQGGFTIAAGLESVIEFLENFHFDAASLDYLATLVDSKNCQIFEKPFLDYLSQIKFTGNIDAVPEGSVVFPFEPLLRIEGPLIECQLLETALLNLINFPTLIATKAARMRLAAEPSPILEFGLRRAQGINGGVTASRAAFIGGCQATSNLLAGQIWNIPVRGTHAHSWVMAFEDEKASFSSFAKHMPNDCVLLVDTYNTIDGVKKAIEVAKEMEARGERLQAIRLDSGDLAYLSIKSREMLDAAGLQEVKIIASNELDEILISELKRQGARIDMWGVGTKLVTAMDQPALDGVYKLAAIRDRGTNQPWEYKLKVSDNMMKTTNPGLLQVRRYFSRGEAVADMIFDVAKGISEPPHLIDPLDFTRQKSLEGIKNFKDLLIPIFRQGRALYKTPPLKEIQEKAQNELRSFHPGIKRFFNPHQYIVGMEKGLYDFKIALIQSIRKTQHPRQMKKALLIVDLQNDFLPGGALAVPKGDEVIPFANEEMAKQYDVIVATKDWHPPLHCSFASTHGRGAGEVITLGGITQHLWPDHCLQHSAGSQFAAELNSEKIEKIIFKGTDPLIDSYSTFFDNLHKKKTELDSFLQSKEIGELYILGLATDYCVFYSVLDALALGYKVFVLREGCRSIEQDSGEVEKLFQTMEQKGATIINHSKSII